MSDEVSADVLGMTAQIVSAHVGTNQVAADALPSLIQSIYQALATAGRVEEPPAVKASAVPVKKSMFPEFIICLEDGKKLKMLKRHLRTRYGVTPSEYRSKWGLPDDYPIVVPAYASKRSELALKIGLGRKSPSNREPEVTATPTIPEPVVTRIPARRARGSKRI